MGASAGDFLDHLEQAGLLDPDSLKPLWKQVARAPDLTAEQLATSLVDSGQLTGFQAKNALKALGIAPGEGAPATKTPAAPEKSASEPSAHLASDAPTAETGGGVKSPALPSGSGVSASDRAAALAAKYMARGGAAAAPSKPAPAKSEPGDDLDLDLAPLDDEPKRGGAAAKPKTPEKAPAQTPAPTPQKTAAISAPKQGAAPAQSKGAATPGAKPTTAQPQPKSTAPTPQKPSSTPGAPKPAGTQPQQKSAAPAGATQKPTDAAKQAAAQKQAAQAAQQKAAAAKAKKASDIEELPTLEPVADLEPLASVDDLASLESLTGLPDELSPLLTGSAPLVDAPPVTASPLDLAALEVDPLSTAGPSQALLVAQKKRGPWWKSPWKLGAAAGGTLLGVLVLWLVLTMLRGSPDTLMTAADELYASQTYGDAARRYASFLWRFPSDERAGHARVRRGLAEIHSAISENEGDWGPVLVAAQNELPEMATAAEFSEAQAELAQLLPQMAAGLVAQAKAAGADAAAQQALVAQANEAVLLLDDSAFWPDAWRRGVLLERDKIAESLDDLKRKEARERDLSAALEKMQAAVKAGKAAEIFTARQELVRAHPTLAAHGLVREVMAAAAKQLREEAKPHTVALPAAAPVTKPLGAVVFSARSGSAAPAPAAARVFVTVSGSVFGLEAASGRVLWRYAAGPASPPAVEVKGSAGSDALVWRSAEHELARVSGGEGREHWRTAFGEECAPPLVANDRIYVASRGGKLWSLLPATGKEAAAMALAQELAQPPAFEAKSGRIFQLAEHSNMYVLAGDLSACSNAVYLGHGAGSVVVPPVAVGGCVLVAENAGGDHCLLHVITGSETSSYKEPQEAIRLPGRVLTPLVPLTSGVAVATDRGSIHVLKIDANNELEPLKMQAQFLPETSLPGLPYFTVDETHAWRADEGLARFAILPGKDLLQRRWLKYEGDTFLAAPQRVGDVLITVRERPGTSGASVAALRVDASGAGAGDAETIWETRVGVLPAGPLVTNEGGPPLFAATADGNIIPLDKAALDSGRAEEMSEKPALPPALLEQGTPLANGWAWGNALAPQKVYTFDFRAAKDGVRSWELGLGDALGGEMAALGPGVLVPFATGRLELRNPATGAPLALPLQPRLEPGLRVRWARPAVVGTGPPEFITADSRKKVYRVGLEGDPRFLKQLAVADTNGPPCGPVAILGSTAVVATRGDSGDWLTPFALTDLKAGPPVELASRIALGPQRVGELAVVALESGELVWFTAAGAGGLKETKAAAAVGVLAGPPVLAGNSELLVASADGHVRKFAAASGEVTGELDLGTPLASGPVVLGTRMFVFGRDGTLHFGNLPAKP